MADRTKSVEDCLSTATNLRLTVNKVFQDLLNDPCANNQLPGDSSESGAYVTQNLKRNLVGVYKALSDLDKASDGLASSESRSLSLGNTGLLSLDPLEDRTSLYDRLLETYHWHEKLTSEAQQALSCLKRQHPSPIQSLDGVTSAKKAKTNLRGEIQKALQDCKTLYPLLELSRSTCNTGGAFFLEVVVPKTFKAIIVMQVTEIDQLVVRGLQESSLLEKVEPWPQSRHAVFRKITDHATSVLLHHYSATDPTTQIRGILKWLNSFHGFFSIKCKGCGKHLKEEEENVLLPPCWRTLQDLSPYHYLCRP
ncbi:mediator of RNA polymerase II transcription subunit 27-like [Acropora millepora]|uniref:mediator of RNA polymerase II transcription subunit 27-like n=1 Tax=Acropora millepora TaxID=45264 RepID=UPI001CF3EFC8|nr:mediator of RNA polymerase II transcription subunit 27-like [Acropora millepora]XP_044183810.1 mediator of RNA polymerase II transcription subunit 27-like [Acropora millepora]